jgi:hypothetical protein
MTVPLLLISKEKTMRVCVSNLMRGLLTACLLGASLVPVQA